MCDIVERSLGVIFVEVDIEGCFLIVINIYCRSDEVAGRAQVPRFTLAPHTSPGVSADSEPRCSTEARRQYVQCTRCNPVLNCDCVQPAQYIRMQPRTYMYSIGAVRQNRFEPEYSLGT